MADIGTGAAKGHWIRDITGYQWLVLFIAWAGWSLDITDFTLYTMVLRQALTELLGEGARSQGRERGQIRLLAGPMVRSCSSVRAALTWARQASPLRGRRSAVLGQGESRG